MTIAAARRRLIPGAAALALCTPAPGAPLSDPDTALEDYVGAPDPAYEVVDHGSATGEGYTLHRLRLRSQQWRDPAEAEPARWAHWLAVAVPEQVDGDTGFLIVAGGSNTDAPPEIDAEEVRLAGQLAADTGSVAAVVFQVPNQPLRLPDAPEPLSEDALVAYSWDRAMDTGDWSWPVMLPMVKSVVRAMDAVQATVLQATDSARVERFVLHGESKRGAAVWLTAAVDPRVRAIAPAVFDFLQFPVQAEHHYRVYGTFTPAVQDYADYRILERLRTPEGRDLARVVDPYEYRDRLEMPKLVISAAGDPFFPPDAARFYWPGLPGEKHLLVLANTGHGLDRRLVVRRYRRRMAAWYHSLLTEGGRPRIDWRHDDRGRLYVTASPRPSGARLWVAWNPLARDFRLDPLRALWLPLRAERVGDGSYRADVTAPRWGWVAYFMEMHFRGSSPGRPQVYTTRVFVRPQDPPFRIDQPIRRPRGPQWWQKHLGAGEGSGGAGSRAPTFPLPLLGERIEGPAAAAGILADDGTPAGMARAQCLAVRLNIRRGELGWYSRAGPRERFLWEEWDRVHRAYGSGRAQAAAAICRDLNRLPASG